MDILGVCKEGESFLMVLCEGFFYLVVTKLHINIKEFLDE